MGRNIFLFQPYFGVGGSEKTTISWALKSRGMGLRPLLVTFTSSDASAVAAEHNIHHIELDIGSVNQAFIPLFAVLKRQASQGDIVVAVQPYASYWFVPLSRLFRSLKWVISFRNHPDELIMGAGIRGRVIHRCLPALLRNVDAVTSNSIETIEDLKRIQNNAHYFYVRNSVTVNADRPQEMCAGENRLVFVGRLCDQKRPFLALRIVESLAKKIPISLDVYGDGELRAELEAYATCRNLPVFFHGHKTITTELLSCYDLLLVTSKYEGFPNVILEAGAAALPVVSVRFRSGVTEILELDRGLIISTDVVRAANELQFFLGRPSERRLMGERLFDYVRAHHSEAMQRNDLRALVNAL